MSRIRRQARSRGWRCAGIGACAVLLARCAALDGASAQRQPAGTDRPERYAASWGQFFLETYTNPRQVSLFRLGAGEARPAEYWVFEWTDEGQRLRPLHQAALRTDWVPWSWRAEGDGRFLVTFDDRFEPQGTTDHCVVAYDFVRGKTLSKRADDFVPEKWLGRLSDRRKWDGGPAYVDPLLHVIYTTSPARAREGTHPFVVIDLPSLTVRVEPAPASLPARVYCETSNGHAWEWEFSMGGAPEPNWLAPFALPTFLKGKRVQPLSDRGPFATTRGEVFFRLDAAEGAYVRCAAEEWRDPPSNWAAPAK